MQTTVNLDEALLSQAQALSGLQDRNALLREALKALIQRESALRLATINTTPCQIKAYRWWTKTIGAWKARLG